MTCLILDTYPALKPFRVAHIATQWGLSGVGKAPQLYLSALDPQYFAGEAVAIGEKACARFDVLEKNGIPCHVIASEQLSEFLRKQQYSVLHIHRTGKHDRWWDEILSRVVEAEVPVIYETNIFGRADTSKTPEHFSKQFHISLSAYLKHQRELRAARLERSEKQHVLYYPIEESPKVDAAEKKAARSAYGIPEDALVLTRVGRADIRKWSDLYFEVFDQLHRQGIEFWFLCRSAPKSRIEKLKQRPYGERCIFLEESSNPADVRQTFAAADICAHSSRIGESFGYGIAEAMLLGLPVVVDSTPWADNAQIELVEHGVSGFVCNTAKDFAARIQELASDPSKAQVFGEKGRAKVLCEYDITPIARSLMYHMASSLQAIGLWSEKIPQTWLAFPSQARERQFADEYRARLEAPPGHAPRSPLLGRIGYRGTQGLYWLLKDGVELVNRKIRTRLLRP